ncbi:MAG: DUF222 domain-containing protein [Actinomycetota bacterium]
MTIQAGRSGLSDQVDTVPVDWLADCELVPELQRLRRLIARAEARAAQVVAAAHHRGLPDAQGSGSPTSWLIAATGDPPAVCRSRLRVALSLRHMPVTREAFSQGELSEPRVRLLADAREFSPGNFSRDERLLVSQARSLSARVLPLALTHWRRLADPDGAVADAGKAFERRRLCVSATWAGMVRLDGDSDPESGQVLLKAIGSLAEPWALDRDDPRSPQQRRADALVEICRRHLDGGDAPRQGGVKAHLTLTVSLQDLQGDGVVDMGAGPITAEAARRLACDAELTSIVLDAAGRPVGVGHTSRIVPAALRKALVLRDRTCAHPGCHRPAGWCDAHHIHHWARGGSTTLANLRLLCRRHHRAAHDHNPYPHRE